MLNNDELQVQLREKDKLFAEKDEIVKEMEAKFERKDLWGFKVNLTNSRCSFVRRTSYSRSKMR